MKVIDKKEILFTFKKSYHIAHNEKYFCCCGGSANLYDKKTGEHVSRFSDMVQPSVAKFTTDSRLIVKTTQGDYYI